MNTAPQSRDFSGHTIHEEGSDVIFAGFPVRQDGTQRRAQAFKWNAAQTEMGFEGPVVEPGTLGVVRSRAARHTQNGGGFDYSVYFNVAGETVHLSGLSGNHLIPA